MALSFASAVGNLYNRLGKLGLLVKNTRSSQTTLLASMTDTTNGVVAQYDAESDLQALMGQSYISLLSSLESPCTLAANIAQQTVNRMVFRDSPRINQTLQSQNILASLQNVILQMKQQGATVLAMTVTATPSAFTGVGNGVVVASVRRAYDGVVCENSFAETLQVLCTADSYVGGATEGNEGFTLTGTGNQSDPFAFNWPLGSNCQINFNAVDGNSDNANGNILTNSGYADFTSNAPDNWVLGTGTVAGTNVFEETSIVYDPTTGGKSLRMLGDGATNLSTAQQFDEATLGTGGTLSPLSQYAFNIFMRRDGVAPAAGAMVVELIDGSGAVIADSLGTLNTFSIDLTALTTQWASYTGTFRTPLILPSTYSIRYRMTTPLTTGRSIYLDKGALGAIPLCYTSGPSVVSFSGSVPFNQGDYATVAVTNSRGAAGTLSTWQTLFDQFFQMRANDLLLPSSATPSISDGLIA